jgi:hypothetical protein
VYIFIAVRTIKNQNIHQLCDHLSALLGQENLKYENTKNLEQWQVTDKNRFFLRK